MDKHYGWQEGRGAQGQGRLQNGQRWNEGDRDDDRGMQGALGGEPRGASEQDERRWTSSGGELDREDYMRENEEHSQSRGNFGTRGPSNQPRFGNQSGWSQGGRNESFGGQGYGNQRSGGQAFSGGHYGGFANEASPGQGNYGNRGFSNQGYSGQRFNQGSSGQSRGFAGQGEWNQGGWSQSERDFGQGGPDYGQTFGRGYAGEGSRGQDFSGSGYGNQGYGSRGSMSQSYRGDSSRQSFAGRGFSGRGPKGYQRSDDRIKEQLSDRLMDDDDIDATEISIEVKNGEVTLTGTVNSREEKRAAEDIAEQSPGVREVQNHLRVSQGTSSGQSGPSGRTGASAASSSRQDSTSKSQDPGQSKSRNERE